MRFGLLFFFQDATAHQVKKGEAKLNSRSVKGRQRYRSLLVKWLTLENENKTAVSQDWWHKPSYKVLFDGKLSEDVGLE